MRIELLVFEGCPNWEPARELLQQGMASLGIAGEVQEIPVNSLEQAQALAFPGSPTLRVNGQDVAPLPEGYEPAMGCRTYVVQGRRQGLPDAAWVLDALRKAQAREEAGREGGSGGASEAGTPPRPSEAHSCCTPIAKPRAAATCPACGMEGKPVKPVTLRSLLHPHLRKQVGEAGAGAEAHRAQLGPEGAAQDVRRDEVYRFCASPDCTLVYFSADGTQTFTRADLTVRVGVKERSAPRPLCYCFGHSAESMREEWVQTGKSTVLESVKAELKAGTCHCEVSNPAGGCCLGDLIKETKALTAVAATPSPTDNGGAATKPTCC